MYRVFNSSFNSCSLLKHHIIFPFHLENQLKVPLAKMLVLLGIIKV